MPDAPVDLLLKLSYRRLRYHSCCYFGCTVTRCTIAFLCVSIVIGSFFSYSVPKTLASPDLPNSGVTADGVQLALSQGRLDDLIGMIAHADQSLADLEYDVEGQRQRVNKAVINVQSAQNQARLAELSLKGAMLQQKKADKDAQIAKERLNTLLHRAYAAGILPSTLLIMSTNKDNGSHDILDKSSVLAQLVRKARKSLKESEHQDNIAANSQSISQASFLQAKIAEKNAIQEHEKAEREMAQAIANVNSARDQRRELVLQKSLAQAAYDSLMKYHDDTQARQTAYTNFRSALRDRLYHEAGQLRTAPIRTGQGVDQLKDIQIAGAHTPMVHYLAEIAPIHLSIPGIESLRSVPFINDIPFVGLLTGARSINPTVIAMNSLNTFLSTVLNTSGDPISNVLTGTVRAIEIPLDDISQALGLPQLGIPGLHTRYTPTMQHPILHGSVAVEAIVSRAESALGVPYAWGGGSYNGPTRGIHDGGIADSYGDYNKVGFDCSGLMVFAFAAAGFHLPHYSGYQYNSGPRIPLSQMRRGDMIFYGPGGSQHVALILGDGTMIEAPESGSVVQISQVRTSGAEPYVVRMVS